MKKYEGIQELLSLDDIEECERVFTIKNGYAPFNVSTWNPSEYFLNHYILNQVILSDSDYIHYLYSYELPNDTLLKIRQKIGVKEEYGCIVTNSGTASITLVTAILKQMDIKNILIISPAYYSIFYNCMQQGIEIKEIHMLHKNQSYILPLEQINSVLDTVEAIWITNPIYNTGIYYSDKDISYLKDCVLPNKYLICDECFSLNGKELIRSLDKLDHFIGIYDPMKQIMINGLKFSAILLPIELQKLVNQWSDIVCGSLSYSTIQGIDFFITNYFDILAHKIHQNNIEEFTKIKERIKDFPLIYIDDSVKGHMMMCYIKGWHSNYFQNKKNLYKIIEKTDVSLIPGNRFHFNYADDLCFRINLARNGNGFQEALERLFDYFNTY